MHKYMQAFRRSVSSSSVIGIGVAVVGFVVSAAVGFVWLVSQYLHWIERTFAVSSHVQQIGLALSPFLLLILAPIVSELGEAAVALVKRLMPTAPVKAKVTKQNSAA